MKIYHTLLDKIPRKLGPEQLFMLTILSVNAGNYLYNLILGRLLGPAEFSDAAILITLLLILSFVGMTFQSVAAKYAVLFDGIQLLGFVKFIIKYAAVLGLVAGLGIVIFSTKLQELFHTQTATMFVVFGIGIPLYFVMSVNRGLFQGENLLHKLSSTYQTEMATRLLLTLPILYLFRDYPSSIIVAIGILGSFVVGVFPFHKKIGRGIKTKTNALVDKRSIVIFFALTAFYELTQIIINNSDIILVKHFFNNQQAGLYASLALIGRVVYFVAWMFVMLLLPKVIQMKKNNQETKPILLKYVGYITLLSSCIVGFTALFPEFVVGVLFGSAYVSISFLLWKYALATSLFAIANIFAYYYLSLNQYTPVVLSAILGSTQIGLIVLYHDTLEQVVHMQIIAMVVLLLFQLSYFWLNRKH